MADINWDEFTPIDGGATATAAPPKETNWDDFTPVDVREALADPGYTIPSSPEELATQNLARRQQAAAQGLMLPAEYQSTPLKGAYESLLGISPEMVPSGAGTSMPAVTIPLSAAGKTAAGVAGYLTSPGGMIETAASATPAAPVVWGKWAYDMLKGGVVSAVDAAAELRDLILRQVSEGFVDVNSLGPVKPGDTVQDHVQRIAEDVVNATAGTLFGLGAAEHAVTTGRALLPGGEPTYAGSQQKAAEVHGDLQPRPVEGPGQVPTQEGGPGVQPQAEAVAQAAQVSLTQTGELRSEEEADLHEAIAMLEEDPAVTGRRQVGVNPDGSPKFEDTKQDPAKLRLLNNLKEIRDQGSMAKAEAPEESAPPEEMTEEEMRDQAQVNVLAGLRGKIQPTREELARLYENEYQRLKYQPGEGVTLDDIEKQAMAAVKEAGLTAEVVDSPDDPNAPFSGDKGTFGMRALGGGRIQISRSGMANLIKARNIRPENIADFIKRTVEHERMHDQVIDTIGHQGAEDYWNDLTAVEKAIAAKIYEGNWDPQKHTPSQMGHEVIRRRMERAAGMQPWEFIDTVGKEKWSLKSLQLLDDIISKTREALGTKASARQLFLMRYVQSNVRAAINHMGGVAAPEAAGRKKPEDQDYMGDVVQGDAVRGIPVEDAWNELHHEHGFREGGWRYTAKDKRVYWSPGYDTAEGRAAVDSFLQKRGITDYKHRVATDADLDRLSGMGPWRAPEAAARGEPTDPTEIANRLGNVRFDAVFDPMPGRTKPLWQFTFSAGPGKSASFYTDVGTPLSLVARKAGIKELQMAEGITDIGEATRIYDERQAPEASVRRKPGESDEEFLKRIRSEAGKPGRKRAPAESQYQEKLFVPPVTKEQIEPRPSMEQVYGKPVTEGWVPPKPTELEALAQQTLSSTEPDFEDFLDEIKKQFGPTIARDQVASLWEDQMWKRLTSASPMELASMVKGMGLEGKIGVRRRGDGGRKQAAPGEAELKAAGAVLGGGAKVSGVTVEDIAARIAEAAPAREEPVSAEPTEKGAAFMEAAAKKRKTQAELLRNEADRWEQAKQDLLLDEMAKDKLQRKADSLRAKAAFVEAGGAEKAEASRPKETEEEAFGRRTRNTRSLAMSAIAQKIMGTMEHDATSLNREEIGHEDIDFENENTVEGPVVEITKAQSEHRPTLGKILTEGARRSSRDPVNNTKRVAVFVNEDTGVVDVLSTYEHGRSGAMIYRPGVPGVKGGYRKLSELPPNMRAVYALLLKEPVKDFHMRFDSLGDFNEHFAMPEALRKARAFEYRMYVGEDAPRMNARPMTPEGEEAEYEGAPIEGTEGIQEGGTVQGPAAGTVRGEMGIGRGALERGKGRALVRSEANALHDFLKEQQVEEPGDLQAAVDIIAETAKRKGLRGRHWVVVNALDKALAATERIHPEMTTQQVYEKTLEDVFALHQASQTPDAFVSGAMELYGKEPGPGPAALATSPEHAAAQAVRAQQRVRQATGQPGPVSPAGAVARELSMRQRLPPTVTRGVKPSGVPQELPQGRPAISGPPARLSAAEAQQLAARPPAVGGQIGGVTGLPEEPPTNLPRYQPTEVRTSPELEARNITLQPGARGERPMLSAAERPMTARERAAKRELARYNERLRQLAYTSERYPAPEAFARAKSEAEAAGEQAKEWFKAGWGRRDVKAEEIMMPMDVADNSAHVLARTSGNEVRLSSLKGIVAAAGKPWTNMMARRAQQREAVKAREAAVAVLATGEIQAMPHPTKRNKVKMVWMTNRQTLQDLIAMANNGIRHAQHALTSSDPRLSKIVGPSWMAGAKRLKEIAEYAQAHWSDPQLQDTVHQIRKQMQEQYKRERTNGIRTARDFNYYPGRYEGDLWNDHAVFFPSLSVLGRNFRKPKIFRNSWEAIENGPYVPKNYDAADVIEHRVRQGMSLVNQKVWQNRLKGILDPESSEPVAVEPIKGPGGLQPPTPEYQLVPFQQGRSTLAIRKGFVNTVRAAAGEGGLRDIPVLSEALRLSQWLKHNGLLIYDTFHPARLAQYQAALTGYLPGYKGGFSALEFKEGSLPTAVAKGLISQKAADWATGTVDVNVGQAKVPMTRYQILQAHIQEGLNIGRLQDALYAQVGRVMPGLKVMNKLIFDRITRGFMAESVVRNFEKMNKSHPDVSFKTLVRDVAKDINYFYGNLGRQGSILSRNPTLRDLNQLFFLAPSWVEGLAQKEARFYARAANLPFHAMGRGYRRFDVQSPSPGGSVTTRAAMPPLGALGGGMAKGLAAYFALTQAINLMTRGKFTFQNEESGHKWDAFIPIGEHGFWVNPASVFAELTHDFLRLTETKPTTWDVVDQITRNKLGPWGRFAMVIAREKNDLGQQITSTPGMVKAAAGELVPYPITLTTPAQYVGSKLGLNRPPAPGALPRQLAASLLGVKTSPGESATTQTARAARKFVSAEGLRGEPVRLVPTDEASYVKLSAAIRDGDEGGAEENLKKLRKTHSIEQIFKAMKMRATRPFTGSRMDENYFLGSLDKNGLDLYTKAQAERQDDLMRFYQFMGGLKQIP